MIPEAQATQILCTEPPGFCCRVDPTHQGTKSEKKSSFWFLKRQTNCQKSTYIGGPFVFRVVSKYFECIIVEFLINMQFIEVMTQTHEQRSL